MEINEFIEKFAEAIEANEASALNGDTRFRELEEWSSLSALSVISMFEDELDMDLAVTDFRKAQTIKDLYELTLS